MIWLQNNILSVCLFIIRLTLARFTINRLSSIIPTSIYTPVRVLRRFEIVNRKLKPLRFEVKILKEKKSFGKQKCSRCFYSCWRYVEYSVLVGFTVIITRGNDITSVVHKTQNKTEHVFRRFFKSHFKRLLRHSVFTKNKN